LTVVAIHQPQYLPWLPYFDKADQADIFVYLDNVQYQKNGVQNRNRIKTQQGPLWLTVPVHADLATEIRNVRIVEDGWQRRHVRSIAQNYSRAPYRDLFESGLRAVIERPWTMLAELNFAATEWMLERLGVRARRLRASELGVEGSGEDLVLSICRNVGATEYLSGTGAAEYQHADHFMEQGITLRYQAYRAPEYPQGHAGSGYVPDLSALDLILNTGPEATAILRKGRQ
jgi:hypothetical protein